MNTTKHKKDYFKNIKSRCLNMETRKLDEIHEKRIKICESKREGNSVSNFKDWIYDATVYREWEPDEKKSYKVGKDLEGKIYGTMRFKNGHFKTRPSYTFKEQNGWKRIYEDLSNRYKKSYTISPLIFDGKPFIGRPDIVYRNQKGDIMIIEVKCTKKNNVIPWGGWYNLQCQLWAYSWIDEFKDAKNIYLQADIRTSEKIVNANKTSTWHFEESGIIPFWHIRKNGKLNVNNEKVNQFHEQCRDMFEYYGGEFKE